MTLPVWDQNLTLEKALNQFEHATERLVLLPFGKEQIRTHIFDAATDASLASSRVIYFLENNYKTYENPKVAGLFLEGMGRCISIIDKMRDLYSELKNNFDGSSEEKEKLDRECSIVENYTSIMCLRVDHTREIIGLIRNP